MTSDRHDPDKGDNVESLEDQIKAAAADPDNPRRLEALAITYQQVGRTIDALRQLDRIIELGAADAQVWKRTAQLLVEVGEIAQAAGAFQQSVNLNGSDAEVRHDYGRALYKLGDLAGAANQLEQATRLCDELAPWQALAILAPGHAGYDQHDILRIRRSYAKKLSQQFGTSDLPVEVRTSRPSRGSLKIGYLSSWFDRENYMKPVWGLINQHDRAQFEIHLFSDKDIAAGFPGYEPRREDRLHETGQLDNQQLAQVIGQLGIDILVDLNAYSTPERLGLFVGRPAPRTVAWFNMYATSGLPGFDYIVGDELTVLPHEEVHYSEAVLRVPQSYLTFAVTHDAPPIVDPPCLRHGNVTFGCLAPLYKIGDPVLDAWSTILMAVPSSRLVLGSTSLDSASNRDYLAERFAQRGIEHDRLEMRGRASHFHFVEYYNAIDIALDTFPYNGGTTTMEAIWQGVPVISFAGDRWASRTSASILHETLYSSFVSRDVAGYIRAAIQWGRDARAAERLRELRRTVRSTLTQCPVCDTQRFATAMETVYRKIAG